MADIELVIKIPEEVKEAFDKAKEDDLKGSYYDYNSVIGKAIQNGTPLPKGHGDLKDMGNLQYVFDLTREDPIYSGKDIEWAIKSMKTIIEVDKKVENAEWINNKCSTCGKGIEDLIDSREWYENEKPNYCPFCGKKFTEGKR